MQILKTLAVCGFFVLATSAPLIAQVEDGGPPEPSYDEIAGHLGITDAQMDCLDANRDDFHDAVAPSQQQLRDLKRQLRQAVQNGEETLSFQSQIEGVQASIKAARTTYVAIAQSCLDGNPAGPLNELIAAETLRNEVRQGIGLLLLEPTESRPDGARNRSRGRRGPKGPGGPGGPGGAQ